MSLVLIANAIASVVQGIAANAIYDGLKSRLKPSDPISEPALRKALTEVLQMEGVSVSAETVISLLVSRGSLEISASQIFAKERLVTEARRDAVFSIGNGSALRTAKTAIETGGGAIVGTGAAISQNADGSIGFHVGGADGSIKVYARK